MNSETLRLTAQIATSSAQLGTLALVDDMSATITKTDSRQAQIAVKLRLVGVEV